MNDRSLTDLLKGRLFLSMAFAMFFAVILLTAGSLLLTNIGFSQLEKDIGQTLQTAQSETLSILETNQQQLDRSLKDAQQNADNALSGDLRKRLKAEAAIIEASLHLSVKENAQVLAETLASLSAPALLTRDYARLVRFARGVSDRKGILYAVYQKPDGEYFTHYIDRSDPEVMERLAKGAGKTELTRLLNASENDPTVIQVKADVALENKVLASLVIGATTKAADTVVTAMTSRMSEMASGSSKQVKNVMEREILSVHEILKANDGKLNQQIAGSQTASRQAVKDTASILKWEQAGFATLLGLLILALMCWFFIVRLIKPIHHLTATLSDMASGEADLAGRLPQDGKDEISKLAAAFNAFSERIRQVVAQVGETTGRLALAGEELTRVASDNTQRVEVQKQETEQVATAITEMASTVKEVASSAESAAGAAREAQGEADAGRSVVNDTLGVIDTLAQEVEQAASVINRLEDDSEAIGTVLDVIRNIADQTNLLALNAAIEAARAGEQGRGFAVVAEEVRSLASRTQQSTQEIQDMIQRLQAGAQEAVEVMHAGVETTRDTVTSAKQAGDALGNIVGRVQVINDMNNQIASAAEEQTVVAAEIDRSVVHISDLSSETARVTGELAQSSQALAALGQELRELVGQFRV